MNSLLSITFLTLILVRIDIRQEEDTCWRTYSRRLPSGFAKQGYSSSWPNCGSKCSCCNELYEPSSRGHRRQGFVSRLNIIYTLWAFNVQPFFNSIYCGGDCYQPFAGFGDLVESSYVLFPSIYLFSWYIPTNMGHIINFHYGAPEVFKVIQLWISLLNPKVSGDG